MLTIRDLQVSGEKNIGILHGVSLSLERGALIGLTGPSGAGKTTLIKTIMGMDGSALTITGGDVALDGKNLHSLTARERRALCGKTIGFIPQNPMTAFFRNARVGTQMIETFRLHTKRDKKSANALAEETLNQVNLGDVQRVMHAYPSQLSGGMLQRVAMAMILGINPPYILADEPTSALDSANRDLLLQLLKDYTDAGILFISHDAEAMHSLCSVIHVMQDGAIIEVQPAASFYENPQQCWTKSFVQVANRRERETCTWKELM